ncbi:MAG: PEP-CTERM sorting domain-containing protein, partial [Bryobacteraceae bacterium]|nr:PEP-CTERM sorting domain-containing protein [Bryobacteraceae bacterium]
DAFGEANAIPGNKVVIDQVVFTVGRLDTIAHEVGHLLGLRHDDPGVETDFLMRSGDDRMTPTTIDDITPDGAALDKLTAAQIATALADPKVLTAVPEPATFATMLCGLGVLGLVLRRRKGSRV